MGGWGRGSSSSSGDFYSVTHASRQTTGNKADGGAQYPPELKTEVAVSKGRFRFVPTFCTYISHTALTYLHPARTVAKVTITPPGIVHKGNNYPTGNYSQRLVTPSGTQERPVNTTDTEAITTDVNVVVPSKSTFRDRSNIYLLIFIVLLLVGTMSTWRPKNYGPTWDTMYRPQGYAQKFGFQKIS